MIDRVAFRHWPCLLCLSLVPWMSASVVHATDRGDASAETPSAVSAPSLSAIPQQCVTLRQGQPCFVRLTLQWQLPEVADVCLHAGTELEDEPLRCWQNEHAATMQLSQQLLDAQRYVLLSSEGEVLAEAEVSVAWVYQKRRSRRRWRLF